MRRPALLGIAAVLAVAFTVLWMVPAVAGPSVECGPFDDATCERYVAEVIATYDAATTPEDHRRPVFLPVLSVKLWGCEAAPSYEIEWLGGGWHVDSDFC